MEPIGVPGFLGAVEVQASHPAPSAAAFHHPPGATSATAAAIALSVDSPPYPAPTKLEATAFLPSGPVDRSGSTGTAFLDLPVQGTHPDNTAALPALPAEDVASNETGFSTAPPLAGRKRSQPTGGWGSQPGNGGGASSHRVIGLDVKRQQGDDDDVAEGQRRRQQRPLGEKHAAVGDAVRSPCPSGFALRGDAAAATAIAGGDIAGVAYTDPPAVGAVGLAAGAVAAAAASAEEHEMDHDVGESPVPFPLRSATKQQLGDNGVGGLAIDFSTGTVPPAVDPAVPTAVAAFAGAAAAAVGAVDGIADPVSCLGDYNFSFEVIFLRQPRSRTFVCKPPTVLVL